jgi:hypothetical protein
MAQQDEPRRAHVSTGQVPGDLGDRELGRDDALSGHAIAAEGDRELQHDLTLDAGQSGAAGDLAGGAQVLGHRGQLRVGKAEGAAAGGLGGGHAGPGGAESRGARLEPDQRLARRQPERVRDLEGKEECDHGRRLAPPDEPTMNTAPP